MENVEDYGFSFQAGRSRRLLLAANEVRLAPPPSSSSLCVDMKSGAAIRCANPHAMVMVVAGMACMVSLVCVALALLCWSVVKQRRRRRQQQAASNPQSPALTPPPQLSASAADSAAQYDDAVLVHLPGDEKPQSFAIPKPFLVDGEKDVESSQILVDEKAAKEAKSEPPDERRDRNPVGVD